MNIQRDRLLVDRDDAVVGVLLHGRPRARIDLNSDLAIVLDIVIETQSGESRPHLIGIAKRENCPGDNGAERGEKCEQPQRPKELGPNSQEVVSAAAADGKTPSRELLAQRGPHNHESFALPKLTPQQSTCSNRH